MINDLQQIYENEHYTTRPWNLENANTMVPLKIENETTIFWYAFMAHLKLIIICQKLHSILLSIQALNKEPHNKGETEWVIPDAAMVIKVIVLKSGGDRTFCAGASFKELININDAEAGRIFFSGFALLFY